MRRRKLLVALAGLAVVIAAGVVVLWQGQEPNRITWDNYERIVSDMTPADVEGILGPPGDYRTGPTEECGAAESAWLRATHESAVPTTYGEYWHCDSATILVLIDADGLITKHHWPCRLKGPFDMFLWRAKRQWHRWFPE
jgi:hypothetical protein